MVHPVLSAPAMSLRPLAILAAVTALTLAAPAPARAQTPLFEDATAAAGLQGTAGVRVVFADLDGDGAPDAIVDKTKVFVNVASPASQPGGRRFVRVAGHGPLARAGDRAPDCVVPADVNGDGRLDLFVGRSSDLSNAAFRDDGLRCEVWLGDGRGGFAKRAAAGLQAAAETTIAACLDRKSVV